MQKNLSRYCSNRHNVKPFAGLATLNRVFFGSCRSTYYYYVTLECQTVLFDILLPNALTFYDVLQYVCRIRQLLSADSL